MEIVAALIGLALIEYLVFGFQVGRARGRYGVDAPAVSGHPLFERHYRVQMNTLEMLVVFVPAIVLFGRYVSAPLAAMLGGVYLIGRVLYAVGYVRDPTRRLPGFVLSWLPTLVLLVGGLAGAVLDWL